jgi:hypothetical protein
MRNKKTKIKYEYFIKEDKFLGIIVVENTNYGESQDWLLSTLIQMKTTRFLDLSTSLDRTLSWLRRNHPEFLI